MKDPTDDPVSKFNWSRDSIYGATILLGAGGAIVLVMSMAKIAYLVGPYRVWPVYVMKVYTNKLYH